MSQGHKISSRRRFLFTSGKIIGLAALTFPFKKALTNSAAVISTTRNAIRRFTLVDQLILNIKTKIVHLPTGKIFTNYQDIELKNQKIIDLQTWESQVKTPVHFNKEKSGIILELLALQKLAAGISDKTLTAALNTVALAFTTVYENKPGVHFNKYNFRLHELAAQMIAVNNSIPVSQKWTRFRAATGNISYGIDQLSLKHHLPPRIKWMLNKKDFDDRMAYILKNKTEYTDRLKRRAADYKLS